jgi:DNA-binding NtrC family response regulator
MMSVPASSGPLDGLKVLIVEDEFLILLSLEKMLDELGCEVVASAHRVAKALAMLDTVGAAAAVLDVNVAGEPVYPVAEALAARGIPLVFTTGYGDSGIAPPWKDWPIVQKPFSQDQLERALKAALVRRA